MNGKLDVLVPVCIDGPACHNPAFYFGVAKEMFYQLKTFKFERVAFDSGNFTFDIKPGHAFNHPYK